MSGLNLAKLMIASDFKKTCIYKLVNRSLDWCQDQDLLEEARFAKLFDLWLKSSVESAIVKKSVKI